MKDLELNELYESTDSEVVDNFMEFLDSNLRIRLDYENYLNDIEWISIMENTIPYIDNILRNPNRFIINEEEIVKIELARKITVDSIKHLSKHTNLIQEVDKKNDNVRPSKILNINKEETFDTYENRLIYTLIQNMKMFCNKKRKIIEENLKKNVKDEKKLTYIGTSKVYNEEITMNLNLSTSLKLTDEEKRKKKKQLLNRIEKIEHRINELTLTEVYKDIEKLNIRLIRPPIKKTNLILKNVNFQYAMKLWDYIQENFDNQTKVEKQKREFLEDGRMKKIIDETIMIDYLTTKLLKSKRKTKVDIDFTKERLVENLLERLINIDANLSEEQLKQLIGDKFEKIKYRRIATTQEIQAIFKKNIDEYMQQLI